MYYSQSAQPARYRPHTPNLRAAKRASPSSGWQDGFEERQQIGGAVLQIAADPRIFISAVQNNRHTVMHSGSQFVGQGRSDGGALCHSAPDVDGEAVRLGLNLVRELRETEAQAIIAEVRQAGRSVRCSISVAA